MTSFLCNINTFLKLTPDRIKIDVKTDLEPKCSVLYFPINLDESIVSSVVAETILFDSMLALNHESYLSNRFISLGIDVSYLILN